MPSDEKVTLAMGALAGARDAFRSAVATTIEEVRGLLDAYETPAGERDGRLAEELGTFAAGRIDTARLAEVLVEPHRVGTEEAARIRRALGVLREIQAGGDDVFVASVDPGGTLADEAGRALAHLGRAFGAARVVDLVRDGRFEEREAESLERFPFRRWSRGEREIAPPVVIRVAGEALSAGGLADFMDGVQKIVLVVEGDEAPPAALAPVVSPGVLVVQTDDPEELAALAAWPGPAIAALVPETAARFAHLPGRDGAPGELTVARWADEPTRSLGGRSVFQLREELRTLRALEAKRPGSAPAQAATGAPRAEPVDTGAVSDDPAGVLAAWLLSRADVSDLSTDV